MRVLVCCCAAFFIYSCGGKKEEGVILSTDKMQLVMWDIVQADVFTDKFLKTDSTKKELVKSAALQQKIFELHKITRADYYKSFDYYNSKPDIMRTILDSITVKAERERSGLMMERYSGNPARERN
jgi:hypothetical protein